MFVCLPDKTIIGYTLWSTKYNTITFVKPEHPYIKEEKEINTFPISTVEVDNTIQRCIIINSLKEAKDLIPNFDCSFLNYEKEEEKEEDVLDEKYFPTKEQLYGS